MNILQMHISLDEMLNNLTSNVKDRIYPEVKDDFLNAEIREYVAKNSYRPPADKIDGEQIKQSYRGLKNLLRSFEYVSPPTYSDYERCRYVAFDSIVINSTDPVYLSKPDSDTPITAGYKYQILQKYSGDDFTTYGATSDENVEGGVFIANFATAPIQPTTFANTTVLSYGYANYISGASGDLESGVLYTVVNGTIVFTADDITGKGITVYNDDYDGTTLIYNVNTAQDLTLTAGDKFIINDEKTTTLTDWQNGSVLKQLSTNDAFFEYVSARAKVQFNCSGETKTKTVPVGLVELHAFEHYRSFAHGSAINRPLAAIENNKLILGYTLGDVRIATEKQFDITNVYLTYIKQPATVSLDGNVDCDLDVIVHDSIIKGAATALASAINSGNWDKLMADKQESEMNKDNLKV